MTHPEGLDKQILEAVNQTVYLSPPLSLFPSATASLMFLPAFSSFNPSIFSRNVLSLPSQEEQAIWQGDFMEGNCKETVCHTMWGVFSCLIFLSGHHKWWQLLPWQEFQCRKITVLVSAWKTTAINITYYLSHILFVHAFLGARLNWSVFLCYIFSVQLSIVSIVKTKHCTFIVFFTINLLWFLTITNTIPQNVTFYGLQAKVVQVWSNKRVRKFMTELF